MRIRRQSSFCLLRTIALAFLGISLVAVPANLVWAQLEITEVMFNPNDEGVWEWIEVRNTGGSAVDLNGYLGFNLMDAEVVGPNPTIDGTSALNTTIGAGEVAVIYDAFIQTGNAQNYVDQNFRDAWGLNANVPLLGASFWPGLSNSTGSNGQSIAFWASASDYQADISPVEDDPENMPGVFTNRVTSFANAAFSINYSTDFPAVDGDGSITWTGNGANQVGTNWVLSQTGVNGAVTSTQVQVPGLLNSTDDIGNPGIQPSGVPSATGLHITEIMYDPASPENDWEWVEIYNSTGASINLAGYVLDDINTVAQTVSNIASGSVDAGETAILFNVDDVSAADFASAWGAGLNLVEVTGWDQMILNNGGGGDTVGLWDSFASYDGDNATHANAVVSQVYSEDLGFPSLSQGPSISLADLGFVASDPASWDNAVLGDLIGSFNATGVAGGGGLIDFHPGGDVGSPGNFTIVTQADVDLDNDGDVDGIDFLEIQRTNPTLIPEWEAQYGGGSLSAVSAVPEPTTLAMCGLALAVAPWMRRRHG
ncbi:MAG: lamin tail domain-containing protein [Bythopirellula sp.]